MLQPNGSYYRFGHDQQRYGLRKTNFIIDNDERAHNVDFERFLDTPINKINAEPYIIYSPKHRYREFIRAKQDLKMLETRSEKLKADALKLADDIEYNAKSIYETHLAIDKMRVKFGLKPQKDVC